MKRCMEVEMENAYKVALEKNPVISVMVTPGHFSTGSYHSNYYLDVSRLKSNAMVARDVARELALPYYTSALVDTIVCMENTKVIGAFLADELLQEGTAVMNSGGEIRVITPMHSIEKKLIFYDNELEWITNRNIIVLTAAVSSGQTLRNTLECLLYYNGIVSGISTLFLYTGAKLDVEINTLFTSDDIPGYKVLPAGKCGMCLTGEKLDALISSEGYKKI